MDNRIPNPPSTRRVALFLDLENFIGFCKNLGLKLDLQPILEKLSESGRITIRRSFGDLDQAPLTLGEKRELRRMLQNSLVQHEDIPHLTSYKNTSDIRLVVEALSTAYTYADVDTFAIVSADRDFVPLFNKLRELGRTIIGIGGSPEGTSEAYVTAADEFYYFENLSRPSVVPTETSGVALAVSDGVTDSAAQALREEYFRLLGTAIRATEGRGLKPVGAILMPIMRQLQSDFDLARAGLSSFRDLATRAEAAGLVRAAPSGEDTLVVPITWVPDAVAGQPADSSGALESRAGEYLRFLETKLKCQLPARAQRGHIYDISAQRIRAVSSSGITLNVLSHDVFNASSFPQRELTQVQVYKVLYSLFRARCFLTDPTDDPFDPIVVGIDLDVSRWDEAFIRNTIVVMRKEMRRVALDLKALSLVLTGDEDEEALISNIMYEVG